MRAFLLAAGKGTRLKPYTDKHPKCLIPIHGIPLLKIWIDLLGQHGISQILINTHHFADQVEQFVAQTQPTTSIELNVVHEPDLRGSAGTVWENRAFVRDQSDFIIAYADNLTDLNLSKMSTKHNEFRAMGGVLTMGLITASNPTACGIVTLDKTNRIVNFIEKPKHPESNLANGGVYITSTAIYDIMAGNRCKQKQRGVWDLGHHGLPLMMGKMYGFHIDPHFFLKDIGTPVAYEDALHQWPVYSDSSP